MGSVFNALVIDESPETGHSFRRALSQLGCRVTTAESPEQGMGQLSNGTRFDLVLISLCVRGIGARSLARLVRSQTPDAKILLVTSWQGGFDSSVLMVDGIGAVVHKPLRFNELRTAVLAQLG